MKKQTNTTHSSKVAHWFGEHPAVIATLTAVAVAVAFVMLMGSVKTDIRADAYGAQRSVAVR